jgi:ABC-type amino acid transport substrate-binding protein
MFRQAIIIALLLYLPITHAEEQASLVWGFVRFEPYNYIQDGKVTGDVALKLNKIMTQAGIAYSPLELPNQRAKIYRQDGKIDLLVVIESFISNPDNFLRSRSPIHEIELGALCATSRVKITNKEDLGSVSLILISAYSYGNLLDDKRQINISMSANNHENAVKALLRKRADCALGYKAAFVAEQNKNPQVRFEFTPLATFPVFIYLNKQVPNATTLMDKINQFNQ